MKEICRGCNTADATKATVSLINSFSCFADEFWALLCHRLTVKTHCRRYWRRSNLIFVKEPRIFLSLRCTVIYVSCDWTNPGTTELCLKYTLLRFFFQKEQHFTLLMRDIIHHSLVFMYSFTLFNVESVPSYPLWKRYVIKRIAPRYFAQPEISSNVFWWSGFGNTNFSTRALSHFTQWLKPLCKQCMTSEISFTLKKKKMKKTFSKFSQCLSMSK